MDIPVIGQTYIFFRGRLAEPFTFGAGPESEDVRLFASDEIPFDNIAFSSVSLTLAQWVADKSAGRYTVRHGVIRKKPGVSPFHPDAFDYSDTFPEDV
jgi:ADP-ribose/FAD diphosphatase